MAAGVTASVASISARIASTPSICNARASGADGVSCSSSANASVAAVRVVDQPAVQISSRDRLDGKGRIVGRRGQGHVQLGGASAKQARHRQILLVQHLRRWAAGFRRMAQLLEHAIEMVQRQMPAVALVGDEAEGCGQRSWRAVRGDVLDRAQEPRSVRETHDIGQEAPELKLGMDARGSSRRKILSSTRSSTSTELLLCSAPRRRTGASSGTSQASALARPTRQRSASRR